MMEPWRLQAGLERNVFASGGSVSSDVPTFAFFWLHNWNPEWLPRHLTAKGEMTQQQVRVKCACGWAGPARASQVVAGGDGYDHVLKAWRTELGLD